MAEPPFFVFLSVAYSFVQNGFGFSMKVSSRDEPSIENQMKESSAKNPPSKIK